MGVGEHIGVLVFLDERHCHLWRRKMDRILAILGMLLVLADARAVPLNTELVINGGAELVPH